MATITNALASSTPTAVFTSSGVNVITTMYFCNNNPTDAEAFSVWVVPSGGSVSNTTMIYNNVTVVAKDTYVVDREKLVLSNGDAIYLYGNNSNRISATVSSFSQ
jgi:ATP-dependent protease ClpP protease subunit